jgi:hypothetical protein
LRLEKILIEFPGDVGDLFEVGSCELRFLAFRAISCLFLEFSQRNSDLDSVIYLSTVPSSGFISAMEVFLGKFNDFFFLASTLA